MDLRKLLLVVSLCGTMIAATAQAATSLIINSGLSNPAQQKAFAQVVTEFGKRNPNIQPQVNVYDNQAEKTAIRNWLVDSFIK